MKECYPLFGRRINSEGVSYFLHGLVHDNPLIFISNEFKRTVNEKLGNYDVICEDGFVDWIIGSKSFNEAEYFGLNRIKLAQYLTCLKNYIYNRFVKKTHLTNLMKMIQEMKSIEDFSSIREILFKNYPAEPTGMNTLLFKTNSGTIDNPKGELPLRIKRYIYEAKESLKYAKANDLCELHIIIGCAHELPLEYLLKNQKLLNRLHV